MNAARPDMTMAVCGGNFGVLAEVEPEYDPQTFSRFLTSFRLMLGIPGLLESPKVSYIPQIIGFLSFVSST